MGGAKCKKPEVGYLCAQINSVFGGGGAVCHNYRLLTAKCDELVVQISSDLKKEPGLEKKKKGGSNELHQDSLHHCPMWAPGHTELSSITEHHLNRRVPKKGSRWVQECASLPIIGYCFWHQGRQLPAHTPHTHSTRPRGDKERERERKRKRAEKGGKRQALTHTVQINRDCRISWSTGGSYRTFEWAVESSLSHLQP